jgi:SAM-dependent methyltransferase
VLDVGCGVGAFLRLVADRGARAFGIDASPALAEVARERVPGAELRVGDMEALPSDDDTFDLVTGFNSFFFEAIKELVRPFMPQRPADAPPEPDYSKPGVLEEIALQAGLEPERAFDTTWA